METRTSIKLAALYLYQVIILNVRICTFFILLRSFAGIEITFYCNKQIHIGTKLWLTNTEIDAVLSGFSIYDLIN